MLFRAWMDGGDAKPPLRTIRFAMNFSCINPLSQRRFRWLSSLAVAGLLPFGSSHLAAQTAYTWNGGAGNWSDGTEWDNGTPNDASADVFIDGGKTAVASVVNLAGSYTVGRLTLDAGDTLNINGDQSFTVTAGGFSGSGSLVNNGTINVSSPGGGHYTYLRFAGPGTLADTGTVNLSGSQTIITASTYNDRITLARVRPSPARATWATAVPISPTTG